MKYRVISVQYQPTLIKEYSFKVYMDFVQFKDFRNVKVPLCTGYSNS